MITVPDFIQFNSDHFIGLVIIILIWTCIAKNTNSFSYYDYNNKFINSFIFYPNDLLRLIAVIGLFFCIFILIYGTMMHDDIVTMTNKYLDLKSSHYYSFNNELNNIETSLKNSCIKFKKYMSYTQFFIPLLLITYIWDKIAITNKIFHLNNKQYIYVNNNKNHSEYNYNTNNYDDFSDINNKFDIRYKNFMSSKYAEIMLSNLLLCMGLTKEDLSSNKKINDYFFSTFNNLVTICLSTDIIPLNILSTKLSRLLNDVSKNQEIRNRFESDIRKFFNIPR